MIGLFSGYRRHVLQLASKAHLFPKCIFKKSSEIQCCFSLRRKQTTGCLVQYISVYSMQLFALILFSRITIALYTE